MRDRGSPDSRLGEPNAMQVGAVHDLVRRKAVESSFPFREYLLPPESMRANEEQSHVKNQHCSRDE